MQASPSNFRCLYVDNSKAIRALALAFVGACSLSLAAVGRRNCWEEERGLGHLERMLVKRKVSGVVKLTPSFRSGVVAVAVVLAVVAVVGVVSGGYPQQTKQQGYFPPIQHYSSLGGQPAISRHLDCWLLRNERPSTYTASSLGALCIHVSCF